MAPLAAFALEHSVLVWTLSRAQKENRTVGKELGGSVQVKAH